VASATYFVSVAWVSNRGEEGAGSEIAALTTADGQALTVRAPAALENAAGWNVYAGYAPGPLTLQNDAPLGLSATWTASTGLRQGAAMGTGQAAQYFVRPERLIQRG
jgi:hypothetical protein